MQIFTFLTKQQLVIVPETPDIVDLELPTLPFPIVGPNTSNKDKGLQKIRQADRKKVIGWAIEDIPTGQKWEFFEDMSWETFKKTIGFKGGLQMWYDITGANGETIVLAEDEFNTMWKLAILSWAGHKEYTHIQLGNPKDFQKESESQRESKSNNMPL